MTTTYAHYSSTTPRVFRGSVGYIKFPEKIEVMLNLDFDVVLRKIIVIDGMRSIPRSNPLFESAQRAVLILLGGKSVLVQPDITQRARWGVSPELNARVFIFGRIFGNPVGSIAEWDEAGGRPALEIGPYMTWLETQQFNVNIIYSNLHAGAAV